MDPPTTLYDATVADHKSSMKGSWEGSGFGNGLGVGVLGFRAFGFRGSGSRV